MFPAARFETIVAGWAVFGLVLTLWGMGILLWLKRKGQREETLRERLDPVKSETDKARTLRIWHEGEEAT